MPTDGTWLLLLLLLLLHIKPSAAHLVPGSEDWGHDQTEAHQCNHLSCHLFICFFYYILAQKKSHQKKKKLALFVQQLNLLWWVVSELQKQINKPKSLTKKIPPCNFMHDHHGAQPWALMQPNSQRGLVLVTAAPPGTWSIPAPWRSAGATFLS